MISIQITGLDEVKRQLGTLARQVDFAASRAINTTAFAVNAEIKRDMQSIFKGGATGYTLSAFKVTKADKRNLTASVMLRTDAPGGTGTPFDKALRHLFVGVKRDWKRLEGYLRGLGLIPSGMWAVPGKACPLDQRGNITKTTLREMLGVLKSPIRNLRVHRKSGAGKPLKAIGYFVVLPNTKSNLRPGIYKRIETGKTSVAKSIIMFVRSGAYRQFIDLDRISRVVADKTLQSEFDKELDAAIRTARL